MPVLKSLQKITKYNLGNQDKKKISKSANHEFVTKDLQMVKTRERYTIILENNKPILFSVDDKIYVYTIQAVNTDKKDAVKNKVKLDEGAYKPITNGANIMAPGIYKYKNETSTYSKGDYVYIIINNECVAVGIALLGYNEIDENAKGAAIDVIHCIDDALYTYKD